MTFKQSALFSFLLLQPLTAVNLYVGGSIGIGEIEERMLYFSLADQNYQLSPFRGTSFLGGALLGVEHYFCGVFYAALEGNVFYNNYDKVVPLPVNNTATLNVRLKNSFLYGGDLKLGIPLYAAGYGTTPYLLGGVETGTWRRSVEGFHFDKTVSAPKVGGGLRFRVFSADVDFQYSYAWFGRFHPNTESPFSVNLQSVLLSVNFPLGGLALF